MIIYVEKSNKRFLVKSKYDLRLISIIQTIDKRFWDASKMEWSFPIESYDDFESEVEKLDGIEIEVNEVKPNAILERVDDKIEIKFSQFTNQFGRFMEIENIEYDKDSRKLIMDLEHMPKLISLFKEINMAYVVNSKDGEELESVGEFSKSSERKKKKTIQIENAKKNK